MELKSFSALLDAVYATSAVPDAWPAFLVLLNDVMHGAGAVLFAQDATGQVEFMEEGGFEDGVVTAYNERYSAKNVWLERITNRPGEVVLGHELLPSTQFENTEFYADWLRPYGLYDSIGGVLAATDRGARSHVSVIRRKDGGLITHEETATFRMLMPHILRAVQISRQLANTRLQVAGALQGLRDLGVGLIIVDKRMGVLFASDAAERILRDGAGLTVSGGMLRARGPLITDRLVKLIAEAGRTGVGAVDGGAGGVLRLPRRPGQRPLSALVCPMRFDVPDLERRGVAIVFVADPEVRQMVPEARLSALYDLTPAEARLVAALAGGASLRSHADATGTSINTVKTHLRHVLDKTGARGQSDLIRLMLSEQLARIGPK